MNDAPSSGSLQFWNAVFCEFLFTAKIVNCCHITAVFSSTYRRISVLPRSLLGKVFAKTACHLGFDYEAMVLVGIAV